MGNNQLKSLFDGLINAGTNIAGALTEKAKETDLEALHQRTVKILKGYFEPSLEKQPDQTDQTTGELQAIGKYAKTGPRNSRGGLNYIYEQMPEYLKYGEQGKQYIDILKGLYTNTVNEPDKKRFSGNHMLKRI